jgi:hypothetical protein
MVNGLIGISECRLPHSGRSDWIPEDQAASFCSQLAENCKFISWMDLNAVFQQLGEILRPNWLTCGPKIHTRPSRTNVKLQQNPASQSFQSSQCPWKAGNAWQSSNASALATGIMINEYKWSKIKLQTTFKTLLWQCWCFSHLDGFSLKNIIWFIAVNHSDRQ